MRQIKKNRQNIKTSISQHSKNRDTRLQHKNENMILPLPKFSWRLLTSNLNQPLVRSYQRWSL